MADVKVSVLDGDDGPWEFWVVHIRARVGQHGLTWRPAMNSDNEADARAWADEQPWECRVVYCGVTYHKEGKVSRG